MNSRTAKLINRFATVTRQRSRSIKRAWLKLPRDQRAQAREVFKQEIESLS